MYSHKMLESDALNTMLFVFVISIELLLKFVFYLYMYMHMYFTSPRCTNIYFKGPTKVYNFHVQRSCTHRPHISCSVTSINEHSQQQTPTL